MSKIAIRILILGFVFSVGCYFGMYHNKVQQPSEDLDMSLFWEAYNKLKANYIYPEDLNERDIVHGAIKGMLDSIGDPYTTFYNPEESMEFLDSVSGKYQGVGMEVGMRNGEIRVISPISGTPAERAGIKGGDIIISIDGESTTDMSLEKAVDLIRGEEGTQVEVTVLRGEEKIDLNLRRETINIPSLEWDIKENDIGYLRIHYFHQDLINDFNTIAHEITTGSTEKIILDLRGDPGGSLDSVKKVADWFFAEGDIIVKSKGSDGEVLVEYKAQGNLVRIDQEIVVLIDEGSASASEILAGALRDNREALIVGTSSFGKGSIQSLINLRDMSNIKVTTSHWVTPKGQLITDNGIVPDIEVERTKEDFEKERDPQLEKALDILRGNN